MNDIVLRPYQGESISDLRSGFKEGHDRQVLAASTGAGKSIIAMSMLDAAQTKGSRVTFICDRRVLVDQFSRHLDAHGIDHGVYMAKHWRYRPHARVQVASIQTLERLDAWPVSDLIIIDEIHAVMRKSVVTFLKNNPKVRVIGLTATPFHPALGDHFTSVTNVVTMEQLVAEKYLVPFRVFTAKEIDTKGVKVVAGEWQKDELESRGLKIVGDVVADFVRLSGDIFGGPRKTICFSSGIAHGKALAEQFADVGLNFVQISADDDDEFKAQVLADFAKPDTDINGVISVDILSRGFDQTDVEHVIVARPLRKSFSMHVQMIGRGARAHPGKEFCVIQDHAGNFLRFQDDWERLYSEGTKSLKSGEDAKTRKEPTEREKKAATCPRCKSIFPSHSDTCVTCGYVRMRHNGVVVLPGELEELQRRTKAANVEGQRFFGELVAIALDRGYKPGWAWHQYREKFGVAPTGMADRPLDPSPATLKWVQSRLIAYSKGRAKSEAFA